MINKNYTRKKLYISRICLVCSRNSGLFLSLLSNKLLCRRKQRVCVYVEKTILRYGNVTGFFCGFGFFKWLRRVPFHVQDQWFAAWFLARIHYSYLPCLLAAIKPRNINIYVKIHCLFIFKTLRFGEKNGIFYNFLKLTTFLVKITKDKYKKAIWQKKVTF